MLKRTQNGYKFSSEGVPVLNTTLTSRILLAMVTHKGPHSNFDISGTTPILEILKFHYFDYNFVDILPEHALRLMRCDAIVDAIIQLLTKERVDIPQDLTKPITDPKDLLSNHDTIYRFLFSVGFLSFDTSGHHLLIPNQLAYNVLSKFVLNSAAPPDRIEELRMVTQAFRKGDPAPLCTFIEKRLRCSGLCEGQCWRE